MEGSVKGRRIAHDGELQTVLADTGARPRLLIHVGLPKTATSSLQHNVLMPWHQSGRINFLSRYTEFPARFARIRHDMLEPFDAALGARPLAAAQADAMRPAIEALLMPDRLNVISNERMAGMETVGDGADYCAHAWLDNLRAVFRAADATVLVSLKSPTDFVLSAYAEAFYWRHGGVRRYGTFAKFLRRLLEADQDDPAWIVFFYAAYLHAVQRRFPKIRVLLYEDLLHDSAAYYAKMAPCLEADPAELETLFSVQRRNAGMRTATGKLSRPLTIRHYARKYLGVESRSRSGNARLLQFAAPLIPLYRKFAGWKLPHHAHHRYPTDALRQRVQQHLGLDADSGIWRACGVSVEKLEKYGYLRAAP